MIDHGDLRPCPPGWQIVLHDTDEHVVARCPLAGWSWSSPAQEWLPAYADDTGLHVLNPHSLNGTVTVVPDPAATTLSRALADHTRAIKALEEITGHHGQALTQFGKAVDHHVHELRHFHSGR